MVGKRLLGCECDSDKGKGVCTGVRDGGVASRCVSARDISANRWNDTKIWSARGRWRGRGGDVATSLLSLVAVVFATQRFSVEAAGCSCSTSEAVRLRLLEAHGGARLLFS